MWEALKEISVIVCAILDVRLTYDALDGTHESSYAARMQV